MPDTRQQKESISSAAVMLCVVSRILPTKYGLTYPARLPTELIQAMPAEAAVPDSSVVGNAQNVEYDDAILAVATVMARKLNVPEIPGIADAANAAEQTMLVRAMCHRRSPVLSE